VFSDADTKSHIVDVNFKNNGNNLEKIITNTVSFISKLAVALGVTLFLW
jgi:hypothetical protein